MEEESRTKFVKWLSRLRKPQESEREFADRLGISQPTLNRILSGKKFSEATLSSIATSNAHNLSEEEIFRLAGKLRPRTRIGHPTDEEVRAMFDDLESLKGTSVYGPTVRTLRMLLDIILARTDEADLTHSSDQH